MSMVFRIHPDARSVVVDEFQFITAFFGIDLDRTAAIGAVHGITGFFITIEAEVGIADRAPVFFH